jgi:hypothetical protein
MQTNGDVLRAHADRLNIPARTLEQAQAFMTEAAKKGSALGAARLLLRHGRMTDDARSWLRRAYGQSE